MHWSEHFLSRGYFNHLVFPRISAVAEAGWTPKARKNWLRFAALAPASRNCEANMSFKIAVGGIHTECSTGNPALMVAGNFRVLAGDALSQADYFSFLHEAENVEILPLLHARAVPGGPVSAENLSDIQGGFSCAPCRKPAPRRALSRHAWRDECRGHGRCRGRLDSAARATVGPDCPIAVSYDLHGNVSQTIIDQIDIFAGYRTAPHIDVRETIGPGLFDAGRIA